MRMGQKHRVYLGGVNRKWHPVPLAKLSFLIKPVIDQKLAIVRFQKETGPRYILGRPQKTQLYRHCKTFR
jgi:hypothetical protein